MAGSCSASSPPNHLPVQSPNMTKPPRLVIHIPVLSPNFVPTDGVPPDGNTGYHPVWSRGQTVLFARSAKLPFPDGNGRSEEHTSELQSRENIVCSLLLENK